MSRTSGSKKTEHGGLEDLAGRWRVRALYSEGGDQLLIMRTSVTVCVCVCVCVVCRFQMFPRRPGRSCCPWRKKKQAGSCEGGLLGADGGVWGTGGLH